MVNPLNFLKKHRQKKEKNLDLKEPLFEILNESQTKNEDVAFILKVRLILILVFFWKKLTFFKFNDIKDIIDESVSDKYIIERIDEFIKNNNESQKHIQDFKSGPDEFSLLHISAENCRSKLCLYLIESIQIGK